MLVDPVWAATSTLPGYPPVARSSHATVWVASWAASVLNVGGAVFDDELVVTGGVTPTSYVTLKGHGMTRAIPAPLPGLYWFQAATSLTNGQTEYFGPVSFHVK